MISPLTFKWADEQSFDGVQVWAGAGETRSNESTAKCPNNCHFIHNRRVSAPDAIRDNPSCHKGSFCIGCCNFTGVGDFWIGKGLLHRQSTLQECLPNCPHWSNCIRSCLFHCQGFPGIAALAWSSSSNKLVSFFFLLFICFWFCSFFVSFFWLDVLFMPLMNILAGQIYPSVSSSLYIIFFLFGWMNFINNQQRIYTCTPAKACNTT